MDGLARSIGDWWQQAGVDSFVDETPRDWLAAPRPEPILAPVAEQPAAAERRTPRPTAAGDVPPVAAPAPLAMPETLADFRAWLLADPNIPGRAAARLDAQGSAGAATILVDMPEAEDRATRQLLSGDAGVLLDRMLVAMGLARDVVYLAPFSPARPASGSLDPAIIAGLRPVALHHLALIAPPKVLVMGEAPAQALLGLGSHAARGRAHSIDIAGRSVPVVATFPPRFILQAANKDDLKDRRALIWADLQMFMSL